MRATGKSRHQVNVSISIQLEFYYNEYDWGVIYREIGGQNNKFYKVCSIWSFKRRFAKIS